MNEFDFSNMAVFLVSNGMVLVVDMGNISIKQLGITNEGPPEVEIAIRGFIRPCDWREEVEDLSIRSRREHGLGILPE